jgi:hypothetical protein
MCTQYNIGAFVGSIVTLCVIWMLYHNNGSKLSIPSLTSLDSSEHLGPRANRISQFSPFKNKDGYQKVPEKEIIGSGTSTSIEMKSV